MLLKKITLIIMASFVATCSIAQPFLKKDWNDCVMKNSLGGDTSIAMDIDNDGVNDFSYWSSTNFYSSNNAAFVGVFNGNTDKVKIVEQGYEISSTSALQWHSLAMSMPKEVDAQYFTAFTYDDNTINTTQYVYSGGFIPIKVNNKYGYILLRGCNGSVDAEVLISVLNTAPNTPLLTDGQLTVIDEINRPEIATYSNQILHLRPIEQLTTHYYIYSIDGALVANGAYSVETQLDLSKYNQNMLILTIIDSRGNQLSKKLMKYN